MKGEPEVIARHDPQKMAGALFICVAVAILFALIDTWEGRLSLLSKIPALRWAWVGMLVAFSSLLLVRLVQAVRDDRAAIFDGDRLLLRTPGGHQKALQISQIRSASRSRGLGVILLELDGGHSHYWHAAMLKEARDELISRLNLRIGRPLPSA